MHRLHTRVPGPGDLPDADLPDDQPSRGLLQRLKKALKISSTVVLAVLGAVALSVAVARYKLLTGAATGDELTAEATSAAARPSLAARAAAFEATAAPKPVPPLQFTNAAGQPLTLDSFRGKVVLLNIWATWCTPCRKEMPALDRVQRALGGEDFEVVAVSIDRGGLPAVEALYEELALTSLRMYLDTSATAGDKLGVLGIPTTLLVDPDGREVGRMVGPAQWDSPDSLHHLQQHIDRLTGAR